VRAAGAAAGCHREGSRLQRSSWLVIADKGSNASTS